VSSFLSPRGRRGNKDNQLIFRALFSPPVDILYREYTTAVTAGKIRKQLLDSNTQDADTDAYKRAFMEGGGKHAGYSEDHKEKAEMRDLA
jgi:hypothetical protein